MVKAYLRYEQARAFGVVASPQAPPVYDDTGKHLVTAALERLAVWDVRRGVEAKSLLPPPRESGALPAVTRIARCLLYTYSEPTRLREGSRMPSSA